MAAHLRALVDLITNCPSLKLVDVELKVAQER